MGTSPVAGGPASRRCWLWAHPQLWASVTQAPEQPLTQASAPLTGEESAAWLGEAQGLAEIDQEVGDENPVS